MGNIKILAEHVANQIAAGEVVERPASVVKELVENSIDANSTLIEVTLEEGGLNLIQVKDNGSGMPAEDCSLAFQRHATSKISDGADLFKIKSLGFRGEALPSIAAVAKVTCTTSADHTGLARRLVIAGGQFVNADECAAPQGTDIRVKELFFNTPARLKYMKTIQTELNHVSEYVYRMALAHPDVRFELRHNGQLMLQSPGNGDRLQTIASIYGSTVAKFMIPVAAQTIDYDIQGFVSKPECNRANRNAMTVIVNGRVIKNYAIFQAVIQAYHTLLPIHRFPVAVLSIQMDPLLVDVNVHPAKLEVRFSKERELTECILKMIQTHLLQDNLIPQMIRADQTPIKRHQEIVQTTLPLYDRQSNRNQSVREAQAHPFSVKSAVDATQVLSTATSTSLADAVKESLAVPEPTHPTPSIPIMYPVGQVHGTYIVAQNEQGMYLIDQHAAHERLNYEYFYQKMANPEPISQPLLIPITLEFTSVEMKAIADRLPLLQSVGIDLEPFGGQSYIVRSYPAWFPKEHEQRLIEEMIDYVLINKQPPDIGKLREQAAIMCSCKASVKANHSLTHQEMESLIERLRHARVPFTCPHGRPIIVSFSSYDLEKMFKRVM